MVVDPFADVDAERLPSASAHLYEIAHEQFMLPPVATERRSTCRFYIAIEAIARPVHVDGTPAGPPFRGVVADLSNGGLKILHCEQISTPLLAVRIGLWDDSLTLVIRVIRTHEGETHFEHAGPFLTPLDIDGLSDRMLELVSSEMT